MTHINRLVHSASVSVLIALLLLFAGVPAYCAAAMDTKTGGITVESAWARASATVMRPAAAYLTIHNSGAADTLVSAASPAARMVQIHRTSMEGGIVKMKQVTPLRIPPGGMIRMEPGGYHVMLMGLKRTLEPGRQISITLNFEKAGAITVKVPVKPMDGGRHGGGH